MPGQVTGDESLEDLQDLVAKLQKNVDWIMDGNLSSKNMREIGDYQVGSTYLRSRDGDVGLSSANDAEDPVRFWAGSATKDTAPWRVMKSGKMVATGVLIQNATGTVGISLENTPDDDVMLWAGSANKNTAPWRVYESGIMYSTGGVFRSASGYPRVEVNSVNNLIAAYAAENNYIGFTPVGAGNAPALSIIFNNALVTSLLRSAGGTILSTFGGDPLSLQAAGNLNSTSSGSTTFQSNANVNLNPSGNLQIEGSNGITGTFYVASAPNGPTTTQINFKKGIRIS